MAPDLRKLKDRANEAVQKGKHKKAAELFQELAEADPGDPGWSHRAGEALRKVGRDDEAVTWLLTAAEGYSKQGFLLKGVAVAKVVLGLAAGHEGAQRLLAALLGKLAKPQAAASSALTPAPGAAPTPMAAAALELAPLAESAPGPAPAATRMVELGPDEPLASLPLGLMMEGARRSREMPAVPVMEIPLDDDGIEIGGLELPAAAPAPVAAPPAAPPAPPPAAAAPRRTAAPPPPTAAPPPPVVDRSAESEFDAAPSSLAAALGAVEPIVDLPPAAPALPPIPLFSSLSPDELRCLVHRVEVLEVADGELIFAEGERGDALFVVVRGSVRVFRGAGRDRVDLERLTEGACFGEVSLVSQSPRPVTVVADGEGTLIKLSREVLGEVLGMYPEVLRVLLGFFRSRLVTLLVTSAPLFAPFSPAERESLIHLFRFVEIEAGATIIRQGEPSPGLFILLAGRMDVTIVTEGGEVQLAFLGAGDLLGEMSLLTRGPAMASIRAAVKCWALFVPRERFQGLVLSHPQMLEFVSDLVEQRRMENDATLAGTRPYSEGRLQVY